MTDELRTDDIQLTAADIGQIENASQVDGFFAGLGYDVGNAVNLGHAALGMDSADLRQQIRQIRRVGEDPADGDIVIYLFEVRAVTVALTQTIARSFRERTESALLVLTKDYEKLDFVLVERAVVPSRSRTSPLKQVIRPRALTVARRNPTPVALRILKRFTFTEGDSAFQWEKLRSAFTLAEWTEPDFNNRALFSDYYLKERLTDPALTPAWAEDVRIIGREVFRHLAGARQDLSGKPEDVIRRKLYEPLFGSLGFQTKVNKQGNSSLDEPDYLLYAPGKPDKPIAAALTYVWNRNLDDLDEQRDPETPDEIPGATVVSVLAKAQADWVIVTNGKLWRLYAAHADNRATNYYEVDLEEALAAPDQITALKYWWLFFRAAAFTGFLDALLQQSADYAKSLGDRLKDRVFTAIFPHFAEGFIRHARTQTFEVSETSKVFHDEVFNATLTFLYRLMFILYAESLSLLPAYEARGYGESSLYRLKRELADAAGTIGDEAPKRIAAGYRADATGIYERLQKLFHAIDAGDKSLNLPMYNGGLFNDETAAGKFLASHAIPDRYLALGLDRLCRDVDDKTHALVMIDYKSLGVRQLGSIYEGLLEFKLRSAPEPLVVVKEKGKEVYLPLNEAKGKKAQATLATGDVYLENDKRERKATGSYYTPDYIVKYIVAHTVGPVLARHFEALEPRLRDAQKRYRQHAAQVKARGADQSPELFWRSDAMAGLADDCLSVRTLDPAMGSGHFLVEAVDFISDRVIEFLNGWSENPVWALLARTREDILADMERQGVSIDAEKLTRVALLKRAVLKRCVYGVDLNAMAVELAKVALWLDAFTLGAPLSFLDHHLKQGNSLIGARVKEVSDALEARPGQQLSLLAQSKFAGVMLATDLMRQVSYLSDNTAEQLASSRQAFRSAADHLAPYKRMLDVYTSRWFGNPPHKSGFEPALEFLGRADVEPWLHDPATPLPEQDYMAVAKIGATALAAAAEKRFFHWELEFPEVFFAPGRPGGQDVQLREDGGFDAVIGNPPYVTFQAFSESVRDYYRQKYDYFVQKGDVYLLFLERVGDLAEGKSGRMGMIVSNKFMKANYGSSARKKMYESCEVDALIDFLDTPIFGDVTTYPLIIIRSMKELSTDHSFGWLSIEVSSSGLAEQSLRTDELAIVPNERLADEIWARSPVDVVTKRIGGNNVDALQRLSTQIGRGVVPGWLDAFVLSKSEAISKSLEADFVFDVISGGDVDRYSITPVEERRVLIYPYSSGGTDARRPVADENLIPNIIAHLSKSRAELEARRNWGSLITEQGYRWYELAYASPGMFSPKLIVPDISAYNRFFPDESGTISCLDTCYYVVVKAEVGESFYYLCALLNSRLLDVIFASHTANVRGGYRRYKSQYLSKLPIKRVNFGTSHIRRMQLLERSKALYHDSLDSGDVPMLDFIGDRLKLGESDVVHDLLVFLAQGMIDLNKRKQAEVKRFLGWLEARLRIRPKDGETGIDSLTGKSILQNYLGDYQKGEPELAWDGFFYRLHQNRGRIGVDLADVKGEIQAEYEKSLAVLLPIKRQLALTDDLIDKIVYKLYGLTDEEIEIVERPAYEQALADAKAGVLRDKALQADPDAAAGAIAGALLSAAQRLQGQLALAEERKQLDVDLPGWHLFPAEVVTFLLTAEYNLRTQPESLDFSTSVISYSKAAERMIYHQLFMRFRDESGRGEADCTNRFLKDFMRGERELTLGSFGIILGSSKEVALRAFVQQIYPRAAVTFWGPDGVVPRLNDQVSMALRNNAAYDEMLSKADARSARAWALGILKYL